MNFSSIRRTKKLGMINTIFGSFCSFFNWVPPQISPRKISVSVVIIITYLVGGNPEQTVLSIKNCFKLPKPIYFCQICIKSLTVWLCFWR